MKKTLEIINDLKEKGLVRDYAIGGAIGALRWVEPFFTYDLDIFIIPAQETKNKELILFTPIYDYLAANDYNEWKGQWIMIEGIPVEFIPAEGLARESVENAVDIDFEGVKSKVMIPEYLIAMFLKAGRDKDIIKIKMLLEQTSINKEKLNEILIKYNLHQKFKDLGTIVK